MALSAEYGDVSPGGISLIGSSCSSALAGRRRASAPSARCRRSRRCPSCATTRSENSGTQHARRGASWRGASSAARAARSRSVRVAKRRRANACRNASSGSRLTTTKPRAGSRRSSRDARGRARARGARAPASPRSASPARAPPPTSRLRPAARRTTGCRRAMRRARGQVRADARVDGAADAAARVEQLRRCHLHRRADRQERVGNQLERRRAPRARSAAGPPTTIHPSLTCGRPSDFDAPPRVNVSTSARARQIGDRRSAVERVVGEHLVDDQRPAALAAQRRQAARASRARDVRAGGIVRRHDAARARVSAGARGHAVEVDLPAAVVLEVVRTRRARPRAASGARTADSSGAAPARARPDRTAA